MGDSSNDVTNSIHEKELERIRKSIQKRSEAYSKMLSNRESFLERVTKMHHISQLLIGLFVLVGVAVVRQPPFSCAVRARSRLYRPLKMLLRSENIYVTFVATCSNFVNA